VGRQRGGVHRQRAGVGDAAGEGRLGMQRRR
jgi:hypothetical protein